MAPRPPAPVAALMDKILEEILFRIPPDDPASLLRAALVCKRWGRIVSDHGFRRRFREFHQTPPLLGYFRYENSFVSTSSLRCPLAALFNSHRLIDARRGMRLINARCGVPLLYRVIDARHGRVLLWNLRRQYDDEEEENHFRCLGNEFMVWDPITGERSQLPFPATSNRSGNWGTFNAAVLCAFTDGTCDHLDCGRGHFLVVYVSKSETGMFAHVYSSETAMWSEISAQHLHVDRMYMLPSALVGNALYFVCSAAVLRYDLAAREMSLIQMPSDCVDARTILGATEGGRLERADISSDRLYIYLWSREVGPDADVGWAQRKVINLRKLLPDVPLRSLQLAGYAHGLDVIVVRSSMGAFTIDLKSVQATKVHGEDSVDFWFPYMSFYIPALGAASSEGSRIGTSNAS